MKCNNICIIGIPEEERDQEIEKLFEEIMTVNFSDLVKKKDTLSPGSAESQTRRTQKVPHQDTS